LKPKEEEKHEWIHEDRIEDIVNTSENLKTANSTLNFIKANDMCKY